MKNRSSSRTAFTLTASLIILAAACLALNVGAALAISPQTYSSEISVPEVFSTTPYLFYPRCIEVGPEPDGYIYVLDSAKSRVFVLDSTGALVTSWNGSESGGSALSGPNAMAVDASGNVYVTERYRGTVRRFNYLGVETAWGPSAVTFTTPQAITVDPGGCVWVVDASSIRKFSADGSSVSLQGDFGVGAVGPAPLNPNCMAVDQHGNVFIADTGNSVILGYDNTTLNNTTTFSSPGSGPSQLQNPRGLNIIGTTLYVTDVGNNRVTSNTITYDGSNLVTNVSYAGDYISGVASPFDSAYRAATDTWYVAEYYKHAVSVVTLTSMSRWSTAGTGNGQFDSPTAVAEDAAGNIYVADKTNSRIVKLSSNGTWLANIGEGYVSAPYGLAYNASSNTLYATDIYLSQVIYFTNDAYAGAWGSYGSGDSQFRSPTGITVDQDTGEVYVADTSNHLVKKFNNSGTFISSVNGLTPEAGQLASPGGVALDSYKDIYVVDQIDPGKVCVFNSAGAYVRGWNGSGTPLGTFSYTAAIAVGPDDRVVVSDLKGVQTFDSGGNYLTGVAVRGDDLGEFDYGTGLAFLQNGRLAITDYYNNRLQIFKDITGPTLGYAMTPSTPDGLAGWYLSPPQLELSANEPADIYYRLSDGVNYGDTTAYSTPLTLNEHHSVYIFAVDPAGNFGGGDTFPVSVDTVAPTITGILPAAGYYSSDKTINISASDDNSASWLGYTISLNGAMVGNGSVVSSEGRYVLSALAYDQAGHSSAAQAVTFWIDKTAPTQPTVTSTTHPTAARWYKSDDPNMRFSSTDATSGINGYGIAMNKLAGTVPSARNITAATKLYSNLANGKWFFHARAFDRAGKASAARHRAVWIDDYVPYVSYIYAAGFDNDRPGSYLNFKTKEFMSLYAKATVKVKKGSTYIRTIVTNKQIIANPTGYLTKVWWDGRNSSRRIVGPGTYYLELTVSDLAGNKRVKYYPVAVRD